MALLVQKHEVCTCGHCRCEHVQGFAGCTRDWCFRYTWPGPGAELAVKHKRGVVLRRGER